MIQPLRQRHRRLFILLSIALPLLFVIGVLARKPMPRADASPTGLTGTSNFFTVIKSEPDHLFMKVPMHVRLLREQMNSGDWVISLSAVNAFAQPDVLVYWSPGSVITTNSLPDQARLLGPLSAPALPIPKEAMATNGTLILYSLADNEILDYSPATKLGDTR